MGVELRWKWRKDEGTFGGDGKSIASVSFGWEWKVIKLKAPFTVEGMMMMTSDNGFE